MIKIVYTILVLPQNIQERITFMKMQKKRIVQCGLSLICAFGIALSGMSVHAEEVDSLEDKTSNLQSQLEGINQDLVTISNEIAETEVKIEESNNEVFRLEASLQISRNNEEVQYANMKTRIKYMYENGSDTLLSMVCEAKSMGEFLNRVDFIQNITKYDKDMLENMVKVREGIEEQEAELKAVIAELKDQPGALMPVMQKAQDIYGYLPIEVQTMISDEMGIPLEKVYGVSTFYAQFALQPKGKYKISVCLGTACYVKGSGDIYNALKEKLGIDGGECTADGKFSLDACRCIGACGLAPVITINDEVYGRLIVDDLDEILARYK